MANRGRQTGRMRKGGIIENRYEGESYTVYVNEHAVLIVKINMSLYKLACSSGVEPITMNIILNTLRHEQNISKKNGHETK